METFQVSLLRRQTGERPTKGSTPTAGCGGGRVASWLADSPLPQPSKTSQAGAGGHLGLGRGIDQAREEVGKRGEKSGAGNRAWAAAAAAGREQLFLCCAILCRRQQFCRLALLSLSLSPFGIDPTGEREQLRGNPDKDEDCMAKLLLRPACLVPR